MLSATAAELVRLTRRRCGWRTCTQVKRNELVTACRASPFVLECKDDKAGARQGAQRSMPRWPHSTPRARASACACAAPLCVRVAEDVESCIEREKEAVLVLAQQQGGGGRSRKRRREPLTSVVKLLPEYQPEELYSNSDRRCEQ